MKTPNPIDINYVTANYVIDDEIKTISSSKHIGTIPLPHIFSFVTTTGGYVPLNTITQQASLLSNDIKLAIKKKTESVLGRPASTNELKRNIRVSVSGSTNDLSILFKVSRLETKSECVNRLLQQTRLRRLKQEDKEKKTQRSKEEHIEYNNYKRLKQKFEYNLDNILK